MGKHVLQKHRVPQRYGKPAKRKSIEKCQREGFYGQLGGLGVAAAVLAIPLVFGGAAVVSGVPLDLSSPPGALTSQRPTGPSWLPGSGVGLHTSPGFNPLFRTPLDASVASDPDVLRVALSQPLSGLSSLSPLGHWVRGRWVSTDPIVRPTTPCPSPVLDPAGFRAWFARWFPGHPVPTPPTSPPAPPVVASPAPVADPAPTPVVESPAPVVAPEPQPEPAPDPTPAEPVTVDVPVVDPPPVVIDTPVTPPVEVDVPPIDPPPVDVPPVDVTPVTDPVTDVLPDPVGDVVDQAASTLAAPNSTQQPVDVNSVAPNATPKQNTVTAGGQVELLGAEPLPTRLGPTAHSSSGNGEYVGKHRLRQLPAQSVVQQLRRGVEGSRHVRDSRVGQHSADHRGDSPEGRSRDGDSGRHRRNDRAGDHHKSDHVSHQSGSRSSSKSHSGGSHGGGHGHR